MLFLSMKRYGQSAMKGFLFGIPIDHWSNLFLLLFSKRKEEHNLSKILHSIKKGKINRIDSETKKAKLGNKFK